jgi:hypothetical protein
MLARILRVQTAYNDDGAPELPRRVRGLPTKQWLPRTGLTLRSTRADASGFAKSSSLAVPRACHTQQS